MAFERLQGLGQERFTKIINELMRQTPATQVARMIQQEWGEFQDVADKTLTQQLNRLRLAAAEGMFGKKVADKIQKGAIPQIKLLEGVSLSVLERLEELYEVQRQRVNDLVQKEKNMPLPVGAMLTATNAVFNDTKSLLLDIQKLRFDMGVDEYKGVVPMMKGMAASLTLPDGTNIQKQVFEAVTTVDEILTKRGIHATIDMQRG